MRLFHVSEEKDIKVFEPRLPYRKDLDQSKESSRGYSMCRM
ncbi:hypothetical protein [Oceanirhabdus sp. W0125-5]|nr:hypothetical protein [Oceanirhabdus sp. W0125-5]WBW97814.1 hypothetical protein OW730_03250 [Oceanirhabdus sp. W0125-5]